MASSDSLPTVPYATLLGRVIAQTREARGLTQSRLAETAKLAQPTLSRIERGDGSLSIDQYLALAKALDCQPHALWKMADEAAVQIEQAGGSVKFARAEQLTNLTPFVIGAAVVGAGLFGQLIHNVVAAQISGPAITAKKMPGDEKSR